MTCTKTRLEVCVGVLWAIKTGNYLETQILSREIISSKKLQSIIDSLISQKLIRESRSRKKFDSKYVLTHKGRNVADYFNNIYGEEHADPALYDTALDLHTLKET